MPKDVLDHLSSTGRIDWGLLEAAAVQTCKELTPDRSHNIARIIPKPVA